LTVRFATQTASEEVQVRAAGAEGPHRFRECAVRCDQPLVVRRFLPDRDRVEQVVAVPMGEGGRVVGNGTDALANAEDDHLAERLWSPRLP
jgi:hypothetical protein